MVIRYIKRSCFLSYPSLIYLYSELNPYSTLSSFEEYANLCSLDRFERLNKTVRSLTFIRALA